MISVHPKLTINAAFLQEIKDDNLRLYGLLDHLRACWLVNDPDVFRPEWFTELICDLRDQIAMHFALENAFGYFEKPLTSDPLLSAEAQRLLDQHEELYLQICSIAEGAEELLYPEFDEAGYSRQVDLFKEFYKAFQAHESAEFDLMMNVFLKQQKENRPLVSMDQEAGFCGR